MKTGEWRNAIAAGWSAAMAGQGAIAMGADYIPEQNSRAAIWMRWFARALVNDPVGYRTTAENAAIIQDAALAFNDAYLKGAPGPHQCKSLVARKNAARQFAERLIRPEAQRIRTDPQIAIPLKVSIGLKSPTKRRRHVGPPDSSPSLRIAETGPSRIDVRVTDSESNRRARPKAATGMELYEHIRPHAQVEASRRQDASATDIEITGEPRPETWRYLGVFTTSSFTIEPQVKTDGDEVTLVARWITRRGERGQFGKSVSARLYVNPVANIAGSVNTRRKAA